MIPSSRYQKSLSILSDRQQQQQPSSQPKQQDPYSTLSSLHQQHHQHQNLSSKQQQQANITNLSLLSQLQQNVGHPNQNLFSNHTLLHQPSSSQNSASSQATTLGHPNHPHHLLGHNQHQFNVLSQQPAHHLSHHHLHQLQQQQQHYFNPATNGHLLNLNQNHQSQGSQHSNGSASTATTTAAASQQAAYNLNNSSDYSSSTYHVYDQILGDQMIDDLIVIKQERMKKRLEQEQRRKVILFSLAVILLVGLLMFLIVQLFRATSPSQTDLTLQQRQQHPVTFAYPTSSLSLPQLEAGPPSGQQNDLPGNQNQNTDNNFDGSFTPSGNSRWTPPGAGQTNNNNWQFDPSKFPRPQQPAFGARPNSNTPVIQQQQAAPNSRPFLLMQQPPFGGMTQPVAQPAMPPPPQVQFPPAISVMLMSSTTQQPAAYSSATQKQAPASAQTTPQPAVPQLEQHQQQPPPASRPQSQAPAMQTAASTPSANSESNNLRGCHGKHCNPTSGCPNQCSGRGQCVKSTGPSSSSSSAAAPAQQQDPTNLWLVQHQQPVPEWHCQCAAGTTGDDCGILLERQCNDGLDNDNDGLVDCEDSECCADSVCQMSTLCTKSPDPLDILMRKPPLPPTSSFFQRMQFLIEKQSYTNASNFNDSLLSSSRNVDRASVIRGRVTYQKQGVTGVRVSIAGQINLGVTFTRDGGFFDLMANGGGAVTVECMRPPFATLKKTIRVPWNEIVLMESIELQLATSQSANSDHEHHSLLLPSAHETDTPTCSAHNYSLLRPQIVAAPRSISSAGSRRQASVAQSRHSSQAVKQPQGPRAFILRDSAMVQQSIQLPQSQASSSSQQANDSQVSIVYISSRAREFMSTINIQLTPPVQPQDGPQSRQQLGDELKQVHLKIVIEGILFEQTFEPQLNLSFTYAWNRQNVYRQKSFGLSTASVSVGYEYTDCKHTIWSTKQLQLAGHDLAISDIGAQWNLDLHHRYNYRDSILQRGDGQNFQLKTDKPRVVQPVMGDGYPRQANCPFCDGATSPAEQKLLRPQALVSAPDGALYVGDFNMIRRIEPPVSSQAGATSSSAASQSAERVVRTVLEMPAASSSGAGSPPEYALALNLTPSDAPQLYMADPQRRQVYLVREQRNSQGNAAADASNETTPPVASASADFVADNLVPIAGTGELCPTDDPQSCDDGHAASSARLIEPRALAFDLAGRMYIADGPNVRLVDLDQKIFTILGDYAGAGSVNLVQLRHRQQQPLGSFPCGFGDTLPMHKFAPKAPQDLAFNPIDETLHLLDENVVYKITQDKRVLVVAGRPANCRQADGMTSRSLGPMRRQQMKATEVSLQAARSIAFNQHGDLFIGEDDQTAQSGRVLVVSPVDDTIALYAGHPLATSEQQDQILGKSRATNALLPTGTSSGQSAPRALDYKLGSVGAIALDQQGNLLVADRQQLRVLSIEPDLPQLNGQGEYEIQSPEQPDELLVFNRHGLHVATRELPPDQQLATAGHHRQVTSSSVQQRAHNKYTFAYNVNTSYGQLASVSYANGNKISIYRDGPHHSVKMIETAFGGQCKLDVSRNGQVHSISTMGPGQTKTSMAYHVDGGLLKQSRDQATDELFNFVYDEFGRATAIQRQSPQLPAPVECRLQQADQYASRLANTYLGQQCSALIVAEQ